MRIERREIVTCILLSFITCGIYGIIWFIKLTDDVRMASNDGSLPSGGTAFLYTLITCGIYGYFWAYKMGKGISNAKRERGLPSDDNSTLFVILQLFGLSIVVSCLVQSDLNAMSAMNGQPYPQ